MGQGHGLTVGIEGASNRNRNNRKKLDKKEIKQKNKKISNNRRMEVTKQDLNQSAFK